MFRRLKVVFSIVKSEGIKAGLSWLIITLYRRVIPQKQVIWYNDITEIDTGEFALPESLKLQRFHKLDQVDKGDLKILLESTSDLMGSAANILMRERFNKGAVLWLLKENGHLAGYRWTIANDHVTPTYVPHTEKDVHSIGTELFGDFRGRYLFDLFQRSTLIALKNDGFKRYYSETYLWNKRAIKAISKIGLRKIGIATRFNILGKNVVIWHDMCG